MKNLLDSRRRYEQALESLGTQCATDNSLRNELQTTIAAIDQKLARFSALPVEDSESELAPSSS